jgi:hypothetical protein
MQHIMMYLCWEAHTYRASILQDVHAVYGVYMGELKEHDYCMFLYSMNYNFTDLVMEWNMLEEPKHSHFIFIHTNVLL